MLPLNLNLKSAFSLFNVQSLLEQQQQQQQQQQLLLLQQQSQHHYEQQLQKQQQQIKQLQQLALPAVVQNVCVQKPIDLEAFNQNLFYQAVFAGKDLEIHLDSIIKRKNKLEGLNDFFAGKEAQNFIKLVGNITLASLSRAMEHIDTRIINELVENPMKIILKENVWRLVTQIISKKLFEFNERVQENYYKEISQMLIFKPEVTDVIFAIFKDSQTSTSITLGDLSTFYTMLQSSQIDQSIDSSQQQQQPSKPLQSQQLQNQISETYSNLTFYQYGGEFNKISKAQFCTQLETYITMLSQYFEKQNTIVNFIKRCSKSKLNFREDQLLQSYLKVMGDFKQTNLKNFLPSLARDLFEKIDTLEKSSFSNRVAQVHTKTGTKILFTLFELIQIELDLVHQEEFIQFFIKNLNFNPELQAIQGQQPSTTSAATTTSENQNYYLKTIDKLLNKCVFNGDEKCDCKKCQCIRRNRNSAKESQKKKREALQQIGPLLEKQDLLEKRLQELESENTILRKLISEMVAKGSNNSSVQEIFQPISKIIAYQLKEEIEDSDNLDEKLGANPQKKFCPNPSSNRSHSSTIQSIESLESNENALSQNSARQVASSD